MSIKIPRKFVQLDKLILKFMWKKKRPKIANAILEKNNRIRIDGSSCPII